MTWQSTPRDETRGTTETAVELLTRCLSITSRHCTLSAPKDSEGQLRRPRSCSRGVETLRLSTCWTQGDGAGRMAGALKSESADTSVDG